MRGAFFLLNISPWFSFSCIFSPQSPVQHSEEPSSLMPDRTYIPHYPPQASPDDPRLSSQAVPPTYRGSGSWNNTVR
ncbi:hypothetical protein P171DRAFT_433004, partial [Karstenula rhodostoma CBS 690.94]